MKVRKEVRDKIRIAIAERPSIEKQELVAMLKAYEHSPDTEKLIEQDYSRTADRLIASFRDTSNVREAFAIKTKEKQTEYVVISNSSDPLKLYKVEQQLTAKQAGLIKDIRKVNMRQQEVYGQMNIHDLANGLNALET